MASSREAKREQKQQQHARLMVGRLFVDPLDERK
eukprot:CAMPEP_0113525216 /NCGR_PEP_ID=MMETSP0015_2-20120614/31_1 /TAXON_ID=2838 /ORGANISM="Odontella" /LENGTH=33 /DNA_ID=CAMNT_0000423343 /DNA_START=789 /DNA_END=887 /DNA_ORIENTATION=- /assembly_acc=CAM_ASM_000160